MDQIKRVLRVCLIAVIIFLSMNPYALQASGFSSNDGLTVVGQNMPAEDEAARAKAQTTLNALSPEERVGQLFLVTFKGMDVSETSQIYDLITNHHIGGVVLLDSNDNFIGPENTITSTYNLTTKLQTIEWQNSQESFRESDINRNLQYIPLYIGITQEGDGYPNDQIISGVTQLPSPMAIGATWNPDIARNVGAIMGAELEALGFNLYLGPSLDVLEISNTETGEDLGIRTFGGDPYWVAQMGASYIQGLHQGSNDRLAVIAKHFPGRGSSDRPPLEEVATVRKSLEQLKQIELYPFFEVTGNAINNESITDGLLVSHIRYQGFQGNIRATTNPVSFDEAAMDLLLQLDPFASWRNNGGVIVSDDLGSSAVRKFFDPTGRNFDARQVARRAFLAGNDLLYMNNFIATGDEDSYTTILRTLELFTQKYNEDPAFAMEVDQAVERLLTLKYKLYPSFDLQTVLPSEDNLVIIGTSQNITFTTAQNAVTLISPNAEVLNSILPNPPSNQERIVFITDTVTKRQCSTCPDQNIFAFDALQSAVMRLYGPNGSGEVVSGRLSSYSFLNLLNYLEDKEDEATIEDDILHADWIVFCALDMKSARPESLAMKRFLSEKPDLLLDKKVIAFAYGAPYYLDATDISKLTAYYGIYSKAPAFNEMAARILFKEYKPAGSLPVSVPGIGYDLITATSPDPEQIIPLHLEPLTAIPTPIATTTLESPSETTQEAFIYDTGNVISLHTGIIVDHNQNPVPNGTVARFIFTTYGGPEGETTQQIETTTIDGVAHTEFRVQYPGFLSISAESDPAKISEIISLQILGEESAITVVALLPTTEVTESPQPTSTPTSTITITPTHTQAPTQTPTPEPISRTNAGNWLLAASLIWLSAIGLFWFENTRQTIQWRVRRGLSMVIGGLICYCYLALGLPGSVGLIQAIKPIPATLLVSTIGIIAGWLIGWVWDLIR